MASAVVAAAASVPAAAPALAAGLPEAAAPGCRSVAHLLAVPESGRGVDWLREALQVAVALELATIPPYLCGWWSVGDRTSH
ncbi:ferritin-like domain-containing protein, partial [Streptomyces violaceoruber]